MPRLRPYGRWGLCLRLRRILRSERKCLLRKPMIFSPFRRFYTFTLDVFRVNLSQTFPLIKIYNILGIISSLFSHFYALCNKLWRFSQFFNFTFVHFNNAIWTIVIDLLQRNWQANQKAAKMHCVFWGVYETRLCGMWKMYINISFVYNYVMWNYKNH